MKIGVMGTGAVGGYYGAMLARAGVPVVFIGRPAQVAALRDEGLRLQAQSFDERFPVQASTDASALADCALVLCCVKSGDTESAGTQMAPHLPSHAVVLSLQNGVDNAARLAARLSPSNQVAAAVVYVAAEMMAPDHVRHHGRGELVLARWAAQGSQPSPEAVQALFTQAGVAVELAQDVDAALWSKLVLNCAYNALSAISRLPYGQLVQGDGVLPLMRDIVAECVAVAQASGVTLADPWPAVQRIAATMPGQFSSTAQDLMRGKPSEIDHLNGFIVRRGQALGVPTPVNRALHVLVRLLESAPGNSRTS
ncbi:MAG TPA: 2-dehydropantoate 2-reductase [Ideonella sp.]|uniref:ketopantoate reductase family protein n=1 Tax=Ideonella sp. TaxID=1929293 RepID=UPI002E33276D|nr:2-dehydropantoate 2-reductase [Ideonella sp.]HEX5687288.1 2-dehydropantoate 2-reductase [Ideonella sp.]